MASINDLTSQVNAFLYIDEKNGVILDADKAKDYYIIDDPFQKTLITLDSGSWKDVQLEKLINIKRCINQGNMFYVNESIPIFLQNCSKEIIDSHVPHKFSDHVALYNFTLIDLFLVGILNEEMKKLFELCENNTRKVLIFLSLNHKNATEKKLSNSLSIETELRGKIEINNSAIKKNQLQFAKKTKEIINQYQYQYNDVQIGELRIITSPNYILNTLTKPENPNSINFFLKMNLRTNNSAEFSPIMQKNITRFVPLKIFSVNRETYDSLHLFPNFNDDVELQKSDDDRKESLKTNCNILIGTIPSDSTQYIDFPVFSQTDEISVSLIVNFLNRSKIVDEEKKIEIGKLRSEYSKIPINNLMNLTLNIIKCKLNKTQDIESFIGMSENADLISALSFKTMYGKKNMEELFPILTQLRISDFRFYSEHDIGMILNKKRCELQTIIKPNDGNDLFLSSGVMGFLNTDIKCNGKVWIDCFWWLNNWISKMVFDAWQITMSEISNEARLAATDFFFNRDLYVKPIKIDDATHKSVRSKSLKQFNTKAMIKKYINLKIFNDILANTKTRIYNDHDLGIFAYSSKVNTDNDGEEDADYYDSQISNNIELANMYRTTLHQFDISQKIKKICDDTVKSIIASSSKKIPINVVFANFSTEIDIDCLKRLLNDENDRDFMPIDLLKYLFFALDIISIFKKNNYTISSFQSYSVPEISLPYASSSSSVPTCSSSEGSDSQNESLDDMVLKELETNSKKERKPVDVKIIMIKNLNGLFPIQ